MPKFIIAPNSKPGGLFDTIFRGRDLTSGLYRPSYLDLIMQGKTPEQANAIIKAWDEDNDKQIKVALEKLESLKLQEKIKGAL